MLLVVNPLEMFFGYHPKVENAGITLPERDIFMTSNPKKNFAGADFASAGSIRGLMNLFRPSDVCIGPDGAIYVADWFDARVGGHGTRDTGQTGVFIALHLKEPSFPFQSSISLPLADKLRH